MLNAMSQGRSGSMCTIHADSSAGVFRRLASYAVQAPERLPLESTNILIAGSVHFVVFVDVADELPGRDSPDMSYLSWRRRESHEDPAEPPSRFEALRRRRYVSSVREVIDAEGLQVISNEVYRSRGTAGPASGAPFRSRTLEELVECGFEPASIRADLATWR